MSPGEIAFFSVVAFYLLVGAFTIWNEERIENKYNDKIPLWEYKK